MRERIASLLDQLAWKVLSLSDRVQGDDHHVPLTLADSERWPSEVDYDDARNYGENPLP